MLWLWIAVGIAYPYFWSFGMYYFCWCRNEWLIRYVVDGKAYLDKPSDTFDQDNDGNGGEPFYRGSTEQYQQMIPVQFPPVPER